MRFVAEVIIIGGSLPGVLGASCSSNVFFAPVVSVDVAQINVINEI
jgi:hypothetical protein